MTVKYTAPQGRRVQKLAGQLTHENGKPDKLAIAQAVGVSLDVVNFVLDGTLPGGDAAEAAESPSAGGSKLRRRRSSQDEVLS